MVILTPRRGFTISAATSLINCDVKCRWKLYGICLQGKLIRRKRETYMHNQSSFPVNNLVAFDMIGIFQLWGVRECQTMIPWENNTTVRLCHI